MNAVLARRLSRCRLPAAVALVLSVSALTPGLGRAHAETAGGRLLPAEMHAAAAEAATGETTRTEARPARSGSRTAATPASGVTAPTDNVSTRQMVRRIADSHGVPPELAEAVVTIESRWNPRARSGAGAIGLMQIKYATARGMGYGGSVAGLYEPKTNLTFGLAYLAGAHRLSGGDICGTILRYHAGHGAERMSASTKRYCATAKKLMAAAGWQPGKAPGKTPGPGAAPATAVATIEPGGFIRPQTSPAATATATPAASATSLALVTREPGGLVRPRTTRPATPATPVAARPSVDPDSAVIRPATAGSTDTVIGSSHAARPREDGFVRPGAR